MVEWMAVLGGLSIQFLSVQKSAKCYQCLRNHIRRPQHCLPLLSFDRNFKLMFFQFLFDAGIHTIPLLQIYILIAIQT